MTRFTAIKSVSPFLFNLLHISFKKKSSGFTLVETMIVITIVALLAGFGIAGYARLNNREQLHNSAKDLQQMLRSAQKKARAGEKPSGCITPLVGYAVFVKQNEVQMRAVCQSHLFPRSGGTPVGILVEKRIFSGRVVLDNAGAPPALPPPSSIYAHLWFSVLQGGVGNGGLLEPSGGARENWAVPLPAAGYQIILKNSASKATFSTTRGGELSEIVIEPIISARQL